MVRVHSLQEIEALRLRKSQQEHNYRYRAAGTVHSSPCFGGSYVSSWILIYLLLQVGKFIVGATDTIDAEQATESRVPESLRFPGKFRGEGVRGHQYHVFKEPRYWL